MKNIFKYIVSASALVFAAGTVAMAQGSRELTPKEQAAIKVDKTRTPNGDGSYTLTLDSFVTGEFSNKTTKKVVESNVPLDVVLVLDVSGSMSNSLSNKQSYIARPYQNYTSSSTITNYYFKHTDGNYYKLNRGGNSGARTVYYTVNGTNWYLHGTTVSTTSQTFGNYSGVVYSSVASVNRMDALKSACITFIETIKAKEAEGRAKDPNFYHQISIVTFSTNANIVSGLSREWNTLETSINGLSANGGTHADYGMNYASNVFNNLEGNTGARPNLTVDPETGLISGSQKVLVFFTDGAPNTGNGFGPAVASSVVETAKTLERNNGVKVYSIGTFPWGTTVSGSIKYPTEAQGISDLSNTINKYMHGTSSNYPNATITNSSNFTIDLGTRYTEQIKDADGNVIGTKTPDYYFLASSADELNNVFSSISSSIGDSKPQQVGSDIELESSEVTIRDVITPQFCIPAGGMVKTYVSTIDNITWDPSAPSDESKFVYTWGPLVEVTAEDGIEILDDGSESKTVDVQGFDYTAHWVGFKKQYNGTDDDHLTEDLTKRAVYTEGKVEFGDDEPVHVGQKLVIKIIVTPDPDDEGGLFSTNGEGSGFYIGGTNTSDLKEEFPEQSEVFTPMDLTITKTGLQAGESSIFDIFVPGSTEPLMTIAITSTGAAETTTQTIGKLPIVDENNHPIFYTVIERPTWDWAYDNTLLDGDKTVESYTHALFQMNGPEFISTNKFNFGATPKAGVNDPDDWTNYVYKDEAAQNNQFPNRAFKRVEPTTTTSKKN